MFNTITPVHDQLLSDKADFEMSLTLVNPQGTLYTLWFNGYETEPELERLLITQGAEYTIAPLSALDCVIEQMKDGACPGLIDIASFLSVPRTGEAAVLFNKQNSRELHIDKEGDYARILKDGVELFYWSVDEFDDAPGEVMGAILGYMCQADVNE